MAEDIGTGVFAAAGCHAHIPHMDHTGATDEFTRERHGQYRFFPLTGVCLRRNPGRGDSGQDDAYTLAKAGP